MPRRPMPASSWLIDSWSEAARAVRDDVIVLATEGRSRAGPAAYVLRRTRSCHGSYGASSMERLPNEIAIRKKIERFRAITR